MFFLGFAGQRRLCVIGIFFFETGEPAMIFKVVQAVAEIISSYDRERLAETFKLSKQISCECIQMHKSILKLRLLEGEFLLL